MYLIYMYMYMNRGIRDTSPIRKCPPPWDPRHKHTVQLYMYRGTSLIRNSRPLGPYSKTLHRALWWPLWGGVVLMSEVPLYMFFFK